MRKLSSSIVFATLVLLGLGLGSAEDHPENDIFKDVASWPATAPGEVQLKNFAPFRAIYDRTYRQGAGPNAGDLRQDRVIITAERVSWEGRRAVAITIVDSGIDEHADTNARVSTSFVDLDDLSLIFSMGPVPGKGKDYLLNRVLPDEVRVSMVMTEEQKLTPQKFPVKSRGFGPTAWVMASMDLRVGQKINLDPCFSIPGDVLTSTRFGRILQKRAFKDGEGQQYDSWVLETRRSPSSPRTSQVHLLDRPPYYLGTETVDLDTGERQPFVWLKSFEALDP